jgi:hypothetical protein
MNTGAKALFLSVVTLSLAFAAPHGSRRESVTGGPRGAHPYLLKGASTKNLLGRDGYSPWSILNAPVSDTTRLKVIGILVEFKPDSSNLTTGNGTFGIYNLDNDSVPKTNADIEEWEYYNDSSYVYDNLPHDHAYFHNQLEFARRYFETVSRGRLQITSELFPAEGSDPATVTLDKEMFRYSPGAKKPRETWDEYYYRRTVALMEFVRDAVAAADSFSPSPFDGLRDSAGLLIDADGVKTAILLIHAGASYLTDGGLQGYLGQDTPSDMIDAFISRDWFDYFADTLDFDRDEASGRAGILAANESVLLDEVMMVSETSNQDSLNWGIHGILVNQLARQIGIPDLFSTFSGISGVGAFCIMDFAGYSAARGFIPPWPSAWVRAFMGWDKVIIARPGQRSWPVKAVNADTAGDSTILFVPINDHEYYLIENRQRNLSGDRDRFNYDTTESEDNIIDPFMPVNLANNVTEVDAAAGNAILSAANFDIGLPASGVLVWHVDERLVKERFEANLLNADSLYRAVHLVEADGINDLGVMFQDFFYQALFDYGGARDVFPHTADEDGVKRTVRSFGPFTRPSTRAGDGGHSYLTIRIASLPASTELSKIGDITYTNYVDAVFDISIERDSLVPALPGWPTIAAPGTYFEPALCNVYANGDTLEFAVVDSAGRVFVWPATSGDDDALSSFGEQTAAVARITQRGDTAYAADSSVIVDTIRYLRGLPGAPAGMPATVDGALYIPVHDSIHILESIDQNGSASWNAVALPRRGSSYVCNYAGDRWAIGFSNGAIGLGSGVSLDTVVRTDSIRTGRVQALALVNNQTPLLAAVHHDGVVALIDPARARALSTIKLRKGIAPYSIVTADLDMTDDREYSQIVITDSRQGIWALDTKNNTLDIAPGWSREPNDQASFYTYLEDPASNAIRPLLPRNTGAPALADINRDGVLDIVTGGANGVFVLNSRGVIVPPWPHVLDRRYWYQRGSVVTSPVVALDAHESPATIFASPSGENVSFTVATVDSTNKKEGKVYYRRFDGTRDSLAEATAGFIDSLLVLGDSLILPFVTPGGYVDALTPEARRPGWYASLRTGKQRISHWPLTTGSPAAAAPILADIDQNGRIDLLAISRSGWVNRWELNDSILRNDPVWPQTGYSSARSFAYRGPLDQSTHALEPGIAHFYTYPNPARGLPQVAFKYQLTAAAQSVRIDVFTYTGYHVYSSVDDGAAPSGGRGWNARTLDLGAFGPAVYRCRLEADFGNGQKEVRYWKMAVVK